MRLGPSPAIASVVSQAQGQRAGGDAAGGQFSTDRSANAATRVRRHRLLGPRQHVERRHHQHRHVSGNSMSPSTYVRPHRLSQRTQPRPISLTISQQTPAVPRSLDLSGRSRRSSGAISDAAYTARRTRRSMPILRFDHHSITQHRSPSWPAGLGNSRSFYGCDLVDHPLRHIPCVFVESSESVHMIELAPIVPRPARSYPRRPICSNGTFNGAPPMSMCRSASSLDRVDQYSRDQHPNSSRHYFNGVHSSITLARTRPGHRHIVHHRPGCQHPPTNKLSDGRRSSQFIAVAVHAGFSYPHHDARVVRHVHPNDLL